MGGPPAKGKSLANETSMSKETFNLHLNISPVAYKKEYQRWKCHFVLARRHSAPENVKGASGTLWFN